MYEDLKLYIDGEFTTGDSGVGEDVLNPVDGCRACSRSACQTG